MAVGGLLATMGSLPAEAAWALPAGLAGLLALKITEAAMAHPSPQAFRLARICAAAAIVAGSWAAASPAPGRGTPSAAWAERAMATLADTPTRLGRAAAAAGGPALTDANAP